MIPQQRFKKKKKWITWVGIQLGADYLNMEYSTCEDVSVRNQSGKQKPICKCKQKDCNMFRRWREGLEKGLLPGGTGRRTTTCILRMNRVTREPGPRTGIANLPLLSSSGFLSRDWQRGRPPMTHQTKESENCTFVKFQVHVTEHTMKGQFCS